MPSRLRLAVSLGLTWVASLSQAVAQGSSEGLTLFETKVRPVLVQHCQECHGAKKQSGGVRLDRPDFIKEETEHGPAVVVGKPGESQLWKVLQHGDQPKMPPKLKLPQADIDAIAKWIDLGAPWPKASGLAKGNEQDALKTHWAFQPVRPIAIPAVRDAAWVKSPVDAFILQKLDAKELKPSPPADRRTLLRRLTFDLIGLPPTPEEVAAFEADTASDAVAKVVDRLLASPQYGERWGRYWLDVARYADTKGYVFFEEAQFPWAYTYRDYVIRSFNEDKRYDRFLLEQIAADRLDLGDDPAPLAALGFLTIGGRFMNNVHDVLDDRIDVATRGLMGLTVACARCHDHKYDPVGMKDYYGLYGIFASSTEPMVPPLLAKPPTTEEYAKFDKELKDREKKLTDFVRSKHEELTAGARKRVAEYLVAAQGQLDQPSTEEFMLIADMNDVNPTMTIRWVKYLQKKQRSQDAVFAPWFAFASAEKGKEPSVAEILDRFAKEGKPVNAILANALREAQPKTLVEWSKVYAKVLHQVEDRRMRSNAGTIPNGVENELRLVFWGSDAPPNVALLPYGDLSLLPDRASQGKLRELQGALEKWRSTGAGAPPRAMALAEAKAPFDAFVFLRGNPNQRGDAAPRQTPGWWSGASGKPIAGGGRLELAQSIIDPANPLTARVLVNRIWMHHFGAGLVTTPGDFGLRSDPPSHPELLDHLARRFMEEGWSIKKLHRWIVLSNTYQQRSDDRLEATKLDPENRLLWKFNRQRLDFEGTRDALLAVAGRWDKKVGGPSVGNAFSPGATRRTIYAHLDRLNVPGLFRTFDFPSPDATSPQRSQTTVAPQALFLMNHPLAMDCAAHVAQRPDIAAIKGDAERVDRVHRLLFGRPPTSEESQLAQQFLQAEGAQGWRRYVHALLQTNEFVFID